MEELKIEFDPAAFKHGFTEADIYSVFEKFISDSLMPEYENKYLLMGFDTNGNLLEVMYNFLNEKTVKVFHAMKCRAKFINSLNAYRRRGQ